MPIPSNRWIALGAQPYGGTNFNAPQLANTFAALRGYSVAGLADGAQYTVHGGAAYNDGLQGNFYYLSTSVAADDGFNVIKPTVGAGRWLRKNLENNSVNANQLVALAVGTAALAAESVTEAKIIREFRTLMVPSVAALRAMSFPTALTNQRVRVLGFYAPGDKGGQLLYIDKADAVSVDNSLSVYVAADATRLKSVDEIFDPKRCGAKFDGTTDDTTAFLNCLNVANGRKVKLPAGIIRITAPLSGTTSLNINIEGYSPCYLSHADPIATAIDTYSSDYNAFDASKLTGYSVIKCDNCNLIGAPDSASMNASNKLRSLTDCFIWGTNGAKIGVYSTGSDSVIKNCTFALFASFGVLTRGQITSFYGRIGFLDCGWNVAGSGSATYPNTYYSGCAMLHASNILANDYTTLTPGYRPTSLTIDTIFMLTRQHTGANKSGLRGLQACGLLSSTINSLGGYTGNFLTICNGTQINGHHVENYAASGLIAADATPCAMLFLECGLSLGSGYAANVTVPTKPAIVFNGGANAGISWQSTNSSTGVPSVAGVSRSNLSKQITTITPGGTDYYDFANVVTPDTGFVGFIAASLVKVADYRNYTRTFFATANHEAGVSGYQIMAGSQIATNTTNTGAFTAVITQTWNGGNLRIGITWGASMAAATAWQLDVGLFGTNSLTA